MHTLVILAHPKSDSLSHKLFAKYKQKYPKNTYKIIDLYKEKPLPFLNFASTNETKLQVQKYQNEIKKAQKILVFHPMWWGMPPAILKNFLDHVLTPHFAYKYQAGKFFPLGLLSDKTAEVYITAGGSKLFYIWPFMPHNLLWRFFILGFCGIKTKTIKVFAGLDTGDRVQNRQKILNNF